MQKITEDQEKTECDSCSVESNDERLTSLADAQHAFVKKFNKKQRECIETSGSNTHDDAVLPSNSQGRTHSMQKMSMKQEYTSRQSDTLLANKTREELCIQKTAIQNAYIINLIRKDIKSQMRKMYEESESNICSNRVSISKKPKEKAYLKKIIKQQEKTKYDSSSMHSNDERRMRLLEAQYAFAQRFKEKMREGIESSGSDTSDDAVLPSNSQGRTHSMAPEMDSDLIAKESPKQIKLHSSPVIGCGSPHLLPSLIGEKFHDDSQGIHQFDVWGKSAQFRHTLGHCQ
ncbi:hypothetical protein STEG23_002996 [Scotinomys teguina]